GAAPAHDATVDLAHEHRVAGAARAEPPPALLGRPRLRLERRQAILDALVVDRGDRLGVGRLCGADGHLRHARECGAAIWIRKMNCMNRYDSRYLAPDW